MHISDIAGEKNEMVPAYFLLVSLFISCLEAAPQRDSYDTSALTGQKWPPYKNAGEGYWRQQADWEKEAFEDASKDTQKVVKKNTPKRPNTTKPPQRSSSSQGNRNKGQTG